MYLPGDEGLKLAAAARYLDTPCFSLKFMFSEKHR